ncbi:MAG: DUF4149 domain-containing protein, partial [Gemmatimonadaceae bacterium]
YILILSLWLGAALFFSLGVARAAFQILPSRSLAGQLVGHTLPALLLAGVVGGVLTLWAELRSTVRAGRRLRLLCSASVAILSEAGNLVGQHVDRLRASVGSGFETLPHADPVRLAFGRWHGIAVLLLGFAMLSAAIALVSAARAMPVYRGDGAP